MEASFKNLFTIGGSYTHVSLSNHTKAHLPLLLFFKKNYTVLVIQYNPSLSIKGQ
jgi:hypothetical protein